MNSCKQADKILADNDWKRVKAPDSSWGEKAAAWLVSNAMKAKGKLCGGINKKKKIRFIDLVKSSKVDDVSSILRTSKVAFKKAKMNLRGKTKPSPATVLPLSKEGGILQFLVPLMAGLSAGGSLAGGAASVAKAINEAKEAKLKLDAQKRHNLTMEGQ